MDRWSDERAYQAAKRGVWRGKVVPWEEVLNEYYHLRGWSDRGLPTKEKLKELAIDDLGRDFGVVVGRGAGTIGGKPVEAGNYRERDCGSHRMWFCSPGIRRCKRHA